MNSLLSTVGEEGGKGRSSVNVNVQEGVWRGGGSRGAEVAIGQN